MKIQDFLGLIKDYLEIESSELTIDTELSSLPEFDSMGRMSLISLLDEQFGITLSSSELGQIKSIRSLIEFIGPDKFEK